MEMQEKNATSKLYQRLTGQCFWTLLKIPMDILMNFEGYKFFKFQVLSFLHCLQKGNNLIYV